MTTKVDGNRGFVRNTGRYFHGTTGNEYAPTVTHADPLPASAYLDWGLEVAGASPEYGQYLCHLQQHTGVGVNAFSIKNTEQGLKFEIYVTMYPPMLAMMFGREMPHMRRSEFDPDLNYFLRIEQSFFGQQTRSYDQDALGLSELFAAHFDLDDRMFQERAIAEYTLSTRVGRKVMLPERPARWEGYLWDKRSTALTVEQHGFVVDPIAHEAEMLEFIEDALELEGLPQKAGCPGPRDFFSPWLFEHSASKHRRVGLTHKPMKGGLGIYYRLDYETLLRYLHEFDYPRALIAKFETHRQRIQHLSFDVALAYRVSDGSTQPLRTAVYGMV